MAGSAGDGKSTHWSTVFGFNESMSMSSTLTTLGFLLSMEP
jgi:hypothetical protein